MNLLKGSMTLKTYIDHIFFFMILSQIFFSNLSSEIPEYVHRIENLVRNNPGQLSIKEYTQIAEEIIRQAPCHILIFGVGRDSSLWIDLNSKGTTVFLEDNAHWLDHARRTIPQLDAYLVQYNTQRSQWADFLHSSNENALFMELPPAITNTKWDIIFVDGPEGWSNEKPGRMKSIFMAAELSHRSQNTHIFVHDCDRVVEATYCDVYLKNENLIESCDRLRHYILP